MNSVGRACPPLAGATCKLLRLPPAGALYASRGRRPNLGPLHRPAPRRMGSNRRGEHKGNVDPAAGAI